MIPLMNGTHVCEQCMTRLVLKNGHQKDMCQDVNGLCAQIMLTIIGSILRSYYENSYNHLERKKTFIMISYSYSIASSIQY